MAAFDHLPQINSRNAAHEFPKAINKVASGGRVVLTRRGVAVAALVGLSDLSRLEADAAPATPQGEKKMRVFRFVPTKSKEPIHETFSRVGKTGVTASLTTIDGSGCIDVSAEPDGVAILLEGCQLMGLVGWSRNRPAPSDGDWPAIVESMGGGVIRFYDFDLRRWVHFDPSASTGWRDSTTMAAA